jgi:hypothetical protein
VLGTALLLIRSSINQIVIFTGWRRGGDILDFEAAPETLSRDLSTGPLLLHIGLAFRSDRFGLVRSMHLNPYQAMLLPIRRRPGFF